MSVPGVKNTLLSLVFIGLLLPVSAYAADFVQPPSFRKLDEKVQLIKKNIIKLGHDFALLKDGVGSFTGKEFVVYLDVDHYEGFTLEAVELMLNDEFATRYEFSRDIVDSLLAGGVKRIYTANLKPGIYKVQAKLIGKVGKRHDYSNSIVVQVEKTRAPKTVELKITNIKEKFLPEFAVSEWDY